MQQERRKDDGALQKLAIDMATLLVRYENSEKQHNEDIVERRVMKHDIANILNSMQALTLIKDQIIELSNKITRDVTDISASTARSISEAKSDLTEKINRNTSAISGMIARIDAIENRNARIDGATGAYSRVGGWVWPVITGLGGIVIWGVSWYINHHAGITIGE